MKKIILFSVLLCGLLLPLSSLSGDVVPPHVSQVQGINVHGKRSGDVMEKMKVEPSTKTFVHRYTLVYWTNISDTPILIKFGKGEKCEEITRAPHPTRDWWDNKCHITKEPVPPRETFEIYFNEMGSYDYEIQFVGTKSVLKAQLLVN